MTKEVEYEMEKKRYDWPIHESDLPIWQLDQGLLQFGDTGPSHVYMRVSDIANTAGRWHALIGSYYQ